MTSNSLPPESPRRRQLCAALAGAVLSCMLPTARSGLPVTKTELVRKKISATGDTIPVVGMGSWLTFDFDAEQQGSRAALVKVLGKFFDMGGGLVDSSPMYGWSEDVIGYCLKQLTYPDSLFAATKVWTNGREQGVRQMEHSRQLWGVPHFDLMQIHNLLDWQTHVETLKAWKQAGLIRHLGITTSHSRRHDELERALLQEDFDFVQLTYNVLDREAERRLLPLALEKGIAVIANRPFQGAQLFTRVRGVALPQWAREFDCNNWAQFFLKFIVSHPAVTCAIPATSQVAHMEQNMGAAYGFMPDAAIRRRMAEFFTAL